MTSHQELIKTYLSSCVVIADHENGTHNTQKTDGLTNNAASHALITKAPENSTLAEVVPSNKKSKGARGASSFSLPRVVVNALIDQKATAYEICVMLVLACFTGKDGMYSTSGITGVWRRTGANKSKNGTLDRAIHSLLGMRVYKEIQIGKAENTKVDLGPLLHDAESWFKRNGIEPPKPVHPRAEVKFVIERFDEMDTERVWFASNLVLGFGAFKKPLQQLLESGNSDVARLLLLMYAQQDMPGWGGVMPYSQGHSQLDEGVVAAVYEPEPAYCEDIDGGAKAFVARRVAGWHVNPMACQRAMDECAPDCVPDCSVHHYKNMNAFTRALEELIHIGLVYEVVTVLNKKLVSPNCIPEGASPHHELASLSQHGFTNRNEHGVGWATEITCQGLDASLLDQDDEIGGRYAVIVRKTIDVMIVGIIRIRFRVANAKNNTVAAEVVARLERNTRAFDYINRIRLHNDLDELMASDCKVPSMMSTPPV